MMNPDDDLVAQQASVEGVGTPLSTEEQEWLQRARVLYRTSTDYYESSLYEEWRANLAHFRSEHAPGSKYESPAYRFRSSVFRPKPRAASRTLEAVAAAALFSNRDPASLEGVDPNNKLQADAAKLHAALLKHRLSVSVPWFLTAIGAYQDTHIYGVCITKQYWDLRAIEDVSYEPAFDDDERPIFDDDGVMLGREVKERVVIADKPAIDSIAPENFRWDPGADWRDPVNSSPYLIEMIPMFLGDVQAMSDDGWRSYDAATLLAHGRAAAGDDGESVRDAREGRGREDASDAQPSEYDLIWVRFYIIRDKKGCDWCFYTVGDSLLLTDPAKLKDFDPLERSRYTVGFSVIEAHRSHPSGTLTLGRPLAELTNDITNQRLDNVKLVLNKRYIYRREAKIDQHALMRNVPGGGVGVDDIERDLKVMDTPEVTSSSFAEQDRLAVESDELLGTFSQASVGSNRALNETVGGMNIMNQAANQVQELGLKTFVHTWVEPVLRAMVKLEALYETDDTILALAASRADIDRQVDDELMLQDLVVSVNVGMGNTNPTQKLQRFIEPIKIAGNLPQFAERLDYNEIGKEMFALAGMADGERFMLTDDEMAKRAEAEQGPSDPRIVVEQMRSEIKQIELELRAKEFEQKSLLDQINSEREHERGMAKLALDRDLKLEDLYQKLGMEERGMALRAELEARRDQTERDKAALQARLQELTQRLQARNLASGYDTF